MPRAYGLDTPEGRKIVPGARGGLDNKRRRGKRPDKMSNVVKTGGGSRTFKTAKERKTRANADPRMPARSPVE